LPIFQLTRGSTAAATQQAMRLVRRQPLSQGNFRRSQIVDFRGACAPAFVIALDGIVTDRY
jgi:hypothetical protein